MNKNRLAEIQDNLQALSSALEDLEDRITALQTEQETILSEEIEFALGVFTEAVPQECILYAGDPIMIKLFFPVYSFEKAFIDLIDDVKWINDVRIYHDREILVYGEVSKILHFCAGVKAKPILRAVEKEVLEYQAATMKELQGITTIINLINTIGMRQ